MSRFPQNFSQSKEEFTSPVLPFHLERFAPPLAAEAMRPMSTMIRRFTRLAEASLPYSVFNSKVPFSRLLPELASRRLCSVLGKLRTRVWLPVLRFPPQNLGSLFQPPTLLGFALQSLSPPQ